jgi:hypothetical protein
MADKSYKNIDVLTARPTSKLKIKQDLYDEFVESIWQDFSLAIGIALRQYI